MGGRIGLLAFFAWIVCGLPSGVGAETIRLLAVPSAEEGKISSEGTIRIFKGDREIDSVSPGEPLRVLPASSGFRVNGVLHRTDRLILRASQPMKFNKAVLKGEALLYKKGSTISVVDILDLEEYLKGVLGQEMPSNWEIEALKAQAVAARTYALHQRANRRDTLYDVGATTDDQVYSSRTPAKPRVHQAVEETRGLILTLGDQPILAAYHSSCGGQTESVKDLWGFDLPYLRSVDCPYDAKSPYHVWKREIDLDRIERVLREGGHPLGTIATLTPYRKNPSGRVERMRILHSDGVLIIKGGEFRKLVGYEVLPSASFEVDSLGSRVGFSGKGRGHGVGLCQWGAKGMAEEGHDFREILNFYYPGVEIKAVEG
ncbi:MAG: SpoIID/LytB domain-containing protein [Nitrospirae bacterium]|nr:SpoIID/LytB domain-containing protein [Nitrospirota bacterium]